MLAIGLLSIDFILKCVPSTLKVPRTFIRKACWTLSKTFPASIERLYPLRCISTSEEQHCRQETTKLPETGWTYKFGSFLACGIWQVQTECGFLRSSFCHAETLILLLPIIAIKTQLSNYFKVAKSKATKQVPVCAVCCSICACGVWCLLFHMYMWCVSCVVPYVHAVCVVWLFHMYMHCVAVPYGDVVCVVCCYILRVVCGAWLFHMYMSLRKFSHPSFPCTK